MQMEAEVESTFLTQKILSFKVNEFVFLVLEKKIELLPVIINADSFVKKNNMSV